MARSSLMQWTLVAGLIVSVSSVVPAGSREHVKAAGDRLTLLSREQTDGPVERALRGNAFDGERWSLDTFALATTNIGSGPNASFYGGGIGLNYELSDRFVARAEAIGLSANQAFDDAAGGGFSLLGRWRFHRGEKLSLYLEGGAGILQTSVSVPDGPAAFEEDGTHFNFTPQAGIGATYRLGKRTALTGGFRYLHISNASMSGRDENPGLDTVGGYLGLRFEF